MRKVAALVLITLALAAMVGTVSAQGGGVIEPWRVRTFELGGIVQP